MAGVAPLEVRQPLFIELLEQIVITHYPRLRQRPHEPLIDFRHQSHIMQSFRSGPAAVMIATASALGPSNRRERRLGRLILEADITDITAARVFSLGNRTVNRIGYGAMQLTGPDVFGPPKDRNAAIAVLREAVARGVNHIDTSDYYGPHITNQLIREALHPYPDDLVIVTKVGAVRGADASWIPARTPADLTRAVHDNLRNLKVDALDVVNLRVGGISEPIEGSIEEEFATLADLQQHGLIQQLGLSNVTSAQVKQANSIAKVVCVQNHYNLVHRDDDALIDELADSGIAYVPFFPLGGFTPLQSSTLSEVATRLGATPMQVALAWLLHRAPNILLIPGTSSIAHLHENLAAAELALTDGTLTKLGAIDGEGVQRAP
jgi:aryl-alcohol dehydrogenase-like predicted oxidoreductase